MGAGAQKQRRENSPVASPATVGLEKAQQIITDGSSSGRPSYSLSVNSDQEVQRVTLDSFETYRVIGGNSWSRILLAKEKSSGEPVALKVYWKGNVLQADEVRHCINEKKALELVKSQWWQRLLGRGQDDHCLYFSLEYVPGGELGRLVRHYGRLTLRETEFYAAEVVLALSDIHSWRFIYRDLKPENVLLDSRGHIKLSDMHLAKFMKRDSRTYTLCGTPEYLSPEMVDGSGHSFESDWWQLGIFVYELLSAKTPFYDPSPYRLYAKVLVEEVKFPGYFTHTTCLFLSELLQKQPKARPKEQQIKYHQFFANVDWAKVARQQIVPPFINRAKDKADDSHYEKYPLFQHFSQPGISCTEVFEGF